MRSSLAVAPVQRFVVRAAAIICQSPAQIKSKKYNTPNKPTPKTTPAMARLPLVRRRFISSKRPLAKTIIVALWTLSRPEFFRTLVSGGIGSEVQGLLMGGGGF